MKSRPCPRCLKQHVVARVLGADSARSFLAVKPADLAGDEAEVYVDSLLRFTLEPYDPAGWHRPPTTVYVPHPCAERTPA